MVYMAIDFDNSYRQIIDDPRNILASNHTNTKSLCVQENGWANIPPEIFRMANLQRLVLSHNRLTELPNEFAQMTELTELFVSSNCLTRFPTELFMSMPHLTRIFIGGNLFTDPPTNIDHLSHLTCLSLDNCGLTQLPDQLWNLTNLTRLDLSHNPIGALSPKIGQLVNLENLSCANCNLRELPVEINLLPALNQLYISNNDLTEFPPGFFDIRRKIFLHFRNNKFTQLPLELAELSWGSQWDYTGNPVEYIPPQLVRRYELVRILYNARFRADLPEFGVTEQDMAFLRDNENLLNRISPAEDHNYANDQQNIHNHQIQQTFRKSVGRLTKTAPGVTQEETIQEILNCPLNQRTKEAIIEWLRDLSIHSELNLNFGEVLVAVWARIRGFNDEIKKEIYLILDEEMLDAECKCFTGRITRLVNCLNGFDPDVIIEISEVDQLSNLVLTIRNRESSIEDQKRELRKEMVERGYPEEKVEEWVGYLGD